METFPSPAEVGRAWFEKMWNERDPELVHRYMSAETVGHIEGGLTIIGPEQFIEFQRPFLDAIPDLCLSVLNILSDEDDVCVHWRARGKHTGAGLNVAATGQPVDFQGVTWFTIRKGKIVIGRDFWNMGGLMSNLAGDVAELS